ncbi:MAG TPA: alpha-2-macroglobulin family protein, partial [Spirochaetia bacterium]|nr:alpha-2-macroglobulin family protein [Spirochaetia bacterium]
MPQDLEPGFYSLSYKRGGTEASEEGSSDESSIGFQVAYFERLKYSVRLSAPDVTYYQGDSITMQLKAEYLSGGALGNADYEYSWYKEPWWWKPEGSEYPEYAFGSSEYDQRYSLSSKTGKLDADGRAQIRQDTTPEGVEGLPYAYNVEAIVQDASYQQIAASSRVVVHPASFYIGVKMASGSGSFARKGEKVNFSSVLVRPDSSPYPAEGLTVKAELYREEWKLAQQRGVAGRINTRFERVTSLEDTRDVLFKGSDAQFQFSPSKAGSYFVKLSGTDKEGRKALTQYHFYVTGSDVVRWGAEDSEDIGLKPDRAIYKPGENARILIQSPLPEGTYLVTVEREGILDEQIVEITGSAETITIPIKESYVPVVYVSVCSYSVRTKVPSHTYFEPDLDKPKGFFGIVPIAVDPESRSFDVAIQSDKLVYRSGGEAEVTLYATKNGKPLADAELTFLAVDRGVLDLINYHVPDPVEFFYSPDRFPLGVFGADSRSLLIDPVTYEVKDLYGGEGEDGKLEERKDFNPTAVFEPFVKTDKNGKAVVKFSLPDTLTTYRCTVIGVKDDSFALNEGEIKVQNPINVRAVIPKRLRFRDTAEVGVLLTNLDEQDREIKVKLSSDNLGIEGKPERTVKVKRGSSLMVWFEVAALKPGDAEIVFTTTSEVLSERLVQSVAVEKPYIFEGVTTMGKVDKPGEAFAEEGLVIPGNAFEGEGSLSLALDGTRLSSLSSAVDFLFHYPYG